MIKDKEECTKKLTKASETFGIYKGRDENPSEKKVVEKATEAVACKKEMIKPLISQVFQCTPTYFWRKLEGPGARS